MPTVNTPVFFRKTGFKHAEDSRSPPQADVIVGANDPMDGNPDTVVRNPNPSWRVQVAKRVDASTYYFKRVHGIKSHREAYCSMRTLPTGITSSYKLSGFSRSLDCGTPVSFGSSFDADLDQVALTRFKQRMRESTKSAQALAPLVESRELYKTIKFAADFTVKMLEAVRDLRKLRGRKAVRLLQDTWLTWNFGIAPMVRDIASIGDAIAEYLVRNDIVLRLYGKASKDTFGAYSPNFYTATDVNQIGLQVKGKGYYRGKLTYKYIGAYNLKFKSAEDYTLLDHLGIDLRSIPSTLWELAVFSWVADYFGTVGAYLSDVFYSPPGNLIYLNRVRIFESEAVSSHGWDVVAGNPNNVVMDASSTGTAVMTLFEYERTVLGSLPTVALRVKSLDEIAPHSITKLFNLLALLGR